MKILKKGLSISCNINGQKIKNAKLQYEEDNWYICQNQVRGSDCRDKLGYALSWSIGSASPENDFIEYYQIKPFFMTQSQRLNFKNESNIA